MSELNGPAAPRPRRARSGTKGAVTPAPALPTRLDELRNALVACVDLLKQRRANLIPPQDIDDFIGLDWLEWNGGNLSLTLTGSNVCRQARTRLPNADD